MFAVVDIAGQQFKVQKSQFLYVHRLAANEGDSVSFDKVLLTANGDNVEIGAPYLAGTKVSAKVLNHLQGEKVMIFKKKRRKGYKKKVGHRQQLTKILIENIG
jgi:large subunit ribosomal protein L21